MILFAIAGAAMAAAIAFLFIRSQASMNTTESLQSAITFLTGCVDDLKATVDSIPTRIVDVIADWQAKNPGAGGTVPDEVIIGAVQAIVDQAKRVSANSVVAGAMFDNQIAHGDPLWPNDPAGAAKTD